MNNLFETWNYEPPHLPLIAHDLLSTITDYDNMILAGNPEYSQRAHEVLINAFLFYMGVQ